MVQQSARAAVLLLGLLSVTACGAGGKGLDRKLDVRDIQVLGQSCGKAYEEMRTANAKEFAALKDLKQPVFDLSQPRDQALFGQMAGQICVAWAKEAFRAAQEGNVELKTIREIWAWTLKSSIQEASERHGRQMKDYENSTGLFNRRHPSARALYVKSMRESVQRLKSDQRIYEVLTGKPYGPQDLQTPDE